MTREFSPESVYEISRNFMESRILLTGVELNLFSLLTVEPLTAQEITSRLELDLRATTVVVDVLSALGFLRKNNDRYQTEPSIAPLLSESSPTSILPGIQHAANLWVTWSQLTNVVHHGGPAKRPDTGRGQDTTKAFIGAMHVGAARVAPNIVEAISPGEAKALIDVGGGSGTYTMAFLQAAHEMKATLFDLPPVIEMARERLSDAGMLDRVNLIEGDYYKDELPSGHDLALLSAIIHQNSFEQNLMLYKKIFRALDSGGRIVIRDHVMEPDRTRPVSGAVFAINMLVNTPGGGTYTFDEIKEALNEAGFTAVNQIQAKGMFALVEAFKP